MRWLYLAPVLLTADKAFASGEWNKDMKPNKHNDWRIKAGGFDAPEEVIMEIEDPFTGNDISTLPDCPWGSSGSSSAIGILNYNVIVNGTFASNFVDSAGDPKTVGGALAAGSLQSNKLIINSNARVDCSNGGNDFNLYGLVVEGSVDAKDTLLYGKYFTQDGSSHNITVNPMPGSGSCTGSGDGPVDVPTFMSWAQGFSEDLANTAPNNILTSDEFNNLVTSVPSGADTAYNIFTFTTCNAPSCPMFPGTMSDPSSIFYNMTTWQGPNNGWPANGIVVLNIPVISGQSFSFKTPDVTQGINPTNVIYNIFPVSESDLSYDPNGAITVSRFSSSSVNGIILAPQADIKDGIGSGSGSFGGILIANSYTQVSTVPVNIKSFAQLGQSSPPVCYPVNVDRIVATQSFSTVITESVTSFIPVSATSTNEVTITSVEPATTTVLVTQTATVVQNPVVELAITETSTVSTQSNVQTVTVSLTTTESTVETTSDITTQSSTSTVQSVTTSAISFTLPIHVTSVSSSTSISLLVLAPVSTVTTSVPTTAISTTAVTSTTDSSVVLTSIVSTTETVVELTSVATLTTTVVDPATIVTNVLQSNDVATIQQNMMDTEYVPTSTVVVLEYHNIKKKNKKEDKEEEKEAEKEAEMEAHNEWLEENRDHYEMKLEMAKGPDTEKWDHEENDWEEKEWDHKDKEESGDWKGKKDKEESGDWKDKKQGEW